MSPLPRSRRRDISRIIKYICAFITTDSGGRDGGVGGGGGAGADLVELVAGGGLKQKRSRQ